MPEISAFLSFLPERFKSFQRQDFLAYCPSRMIWEAIEGASARALSAQERTEYLLGSTGFLVMKEPLAEPCQSPLSTEWDAVELLENHTRWYIDRDFSRNNLFAEEPLYIFPLDFKWMLVYTTENTLTGEQLCVIVENRTGGRFA